MTTKAQSFPFVRILLAMFGCGLLSTSLFAETEGGPRGGRLLAAEPHPVEFFVTPDGHAELTFYDEAGNATGADTAVVAVIAEPASGRTKLALEPIQHGFRSTAPLPAGAPYRVVVQVRAAAGTAPRNFRLDLNLSTCGECRRTEYACTCEGH